MKKPRLLTELAEYILQPASLGIFSQKKWLHVLAFVVFWISVSGVIVALRLYVAEVPTFLRTVATSLESASNSLPVSTTYRLDSDRFYCEDLVNPSNCEVNRSISLPVFATNKDATVNLPEMSILLSTASATAAEITESLPKKPVVVITAETLYLVQSKGGYEAISLSDLELQNPFVLTSLQLRELSMAVEPWLDNNAVVLAVMLLLVTIPFVLINRLVHIFWDSILLFALSQFYRWKMGYGQTLKLALGVGVVAQLLDSFAVLLYGMLPIPLYSIGFWTIYIIVSWTLRKNQLSEEEIKSEAKK